MRTDGNFKLERRPTHPGAILREDVLPALGVSVVDAAHELGTTRQTLHRILSEQQPVTTEMAIRLGKWCGNGALFWLSMQVNVDLWDTEQAIAPKVAKIRTRSAA